MKTLTALIILALASLSMVHASESDNGAPIAIQLPTTETITVAFADDALPPTGEWKAVCMLPASFD
jgi:hypothetical protein